MRGRGRSGIILRVVFAPRGRAHFSARRDRRRPSDKSGRLEKVEEIRLETVVPIGGVDAVMAALRQSHPYEEPAFDLNVLAAGRHGDEGRAESARSPLPLAANLFDRIKRELGIEHLLIAGPMEGTIIAGGGLCRGRAETLLDDAIKARAELYLTGEVRHHDAVKAAAAG